MDLKKILFNKTLKIGILVSAPILIVLIIIVCRHIFIPSNEEIINELKNTDYYSSKVDYVFKNSKSEFKETTIQYYSADKGSRIEFLDGGGRIKVYNGSEIKVEGNSQSDEYILDNDIDIMYPLAFVENILSNPQSGEIREVHGEWDEEIYLELDLKYNSKNKHLNKAEFYVDKNKRVPVLLKIFDDNNKERITITFKDFKIEKRLDNELF